MRLRQVALASSGLEQVTDALAKVFGLRVAYNDPHIHGYGLKNAVLPAGTAFLEVVEPVRDDASAARFIRRRGGDAGYMIIIQAADAIAEQARVEALGVRVVDVIDTATYRCAHFHPADFGGVLTSIDQQRTEADHLAPYGDWMPAGPDWQAARGDQVLDLASATLSAADPAALARRWSELLGRPLDPANALRLPLEHGAVVFEQGVDDTPTLISGLELQVADVAAALARAKVAGLDVSDRGVLIGGVRFSPVT